MSVTANLNISESEIKNGIKEIIVSQFEIAADDISSEKNLFTDLGLDSLDAIDLVIAFQNQFDIKPPNEELQEIRTIEDVYQLVRKYAKLAPISRSSNSIGS